ncbi:MAG: non-histone chromosomal MC1 family protein [Haloquadratum sp.]|jgi:nucleoid protein MC1|nr:non-histone chromosomal MC1 family protein [Haloquadratum sp.]
MVRQDGKRNFVMLDGGAQTRQFTGRMPRQAALKAARRLEGFDRFRSEAQAKQHATQIRLRERGTDRIHVYDAWAWTDEVPPDAPGWMDGSVSQITRGNVAKRGIEHSDD